MRSGAVDLSFCRRAKLYREMMIENTALSECVSPAISWVRRGA